MEDGGGIGQLGDRLKRLLAIAASAVVLAACASTPPAPTPAGSPAPSASPASAAPEPTPDPAPFAPTDVVARLQSLDPGLLLVATTDDRDMGVFPRLVYRGTTTTAKGIGRAVGVVLVYPSPAERIAVQPGFGEMSIQGPRGTINWDGIVHSEWVGVQNVLVEVVVPGGTFGGTATAAEKQYPERVRAALAP